jgi:hypothetical protein
MPIRTEVKPKSCVGGLFSFLHRNNYYLILSLKKGMAFSQGTDDIEKI